VKSGDGSTSKLVEEENTDRRALYELIAKEENVEVDVVAVVLLASGCASIDESEPAATDEKAVEKPPAVAIAKPPATVSKPAAPTPPPIAVVAPVVPAVVALTNVTCDGKARLYHGSVGPYGEPPNLMLQRGEPPVPMVSVTVTAPPPSKVFRILSS
jgi:hypothetical protein